MAITETVVPAAGDPRMIGAVFRVAPLLLRVLALQRAFSIGAYIELSVNLMCYLCAFSHVLRGVGQHIRCSTTFNRDRQRCLISTVTVSHEGVSIYELRQGAVEKCFLVVS
jgi:hypothetical protein